MKLLIDTQKEEIDYLKATIHRLLNPEDNGLIFLKNHVFTNITCNDDEHFKVDNIVKLLFHKTLELDYQYYFITQTFDKSFYQPDIIELQEKYMLKRLKQSINTYNYNVLGCLEFTEKGIIHMHFLIYIPTITQIKLSIDMFNQFSRNQNIYNINHNVKRVKDTPEDLQRVIDYIRKSKHYIFHHVA